MKKQLFKLLVMKTNKSFLLIAVIVMAVLTFEAAYAGNSEGRKKAAQQDLITIRGKIVDSETKAPLIFASVMVKESNVGIVTNIDGEFALKISPSATDIEISYLGYRNLTVSISSLKDKGGMNTIELEPAPIPIREIIEIGRASCRERV